MEEQEQYEGVYTKEEATGKLIDDGHYATPYQIASFWEENGKKADEPIDETEYEKLRESLGDPEKALEQAFAVFDKNKDGYLSKEELYKIIEQSDIYDSGITEQIDQMFKDADRTGKDGEEGPDGLLSLNEFIAAVTGAEYSAFGIKNEILN